MIKVSEIKISGDKQCIHCKNKDKENTTYYRVEIIGYNGGAIAMDLCKDCMLELQDKIRKNISIFG